MSAHLPTTTASPTAAEQALARLQASRERLVREWQPAQAARPSADEGGGRCRLAAWWLLARRGLARTPAVAAAMNVLARAWRRHPGRPELELMALEVRGTVLPLVRRHPLASVGAAAGLAAAVVALRPWRWAWVALAWRPLRSRVLVGAVRHAMAACADAVDPGRPLR